MLICIKVKKTDKLIFFAEISYFHWTVWGIRSDTIRKIIIFNNIIFCDQKQSLNCWQYGKNNLSPLCVFCYFFMRLVNFCLIFHTTYKGIKLYLQVHELDITDEIVQSNFRIWNQRENARNGLSILIFFVDSPTGALFSLFKFKNQN